MHFILLLIIVGLIAWVVSLGGMSGINLGAKTPSDDTEEIVDITAPLDAAREVVNQIESRGTGVIDLSHQGISKVPMYVFDRTETTVLNISNNVLTGALQGEIRKLKNLRTLDMSHNSFTGVPAEIGQLSFLETLNLSHNPLTGLPHEIGNLRNLKILDLRGTEYSAFDLEIIQKSLPATTEIIVK